MSNDEKNNKHEGQLLEHEYDGIKELDNQLPKWWLILFYITIGWSGLYYLYYEFGSGLSIDQEFVSDSTVIEQKKLSKNNGSFPDDKKLNATIADNNLVKSAGTIFLAKCSSCHGDKAQGGIGPNLTDRFWINGKGTIVDISKIIHEGVAAKGMPPWGPLLKEEEIYALAAYISSLNGTNPPGAKAPQGNEIKNN